MEVAGKLWLWAAHRVRLLGCGQGVPLTGVGMQGLLPLSCWEVTGDHRFLRLPLPSLGGGRQLMPTHNREWVPATGWGVTAVQEGTAAQVSWRFGA